MVDPSMTRDQIHGSGSLKDTIAWQWTDNHSNGAATNIIYSRFGHAWHPSESNLYVDAFPKAVGSLNGTGAIVLDASTHYDTHHFAEMETAVTFVRDKSLVTNASIFYMESTPEEWPTNNGMLQGNAIRNVGVRPLVPTESWDEVVSLTPK
jgi:hypothetical protein